MDDKKKVRIDPDKCANCGTCYSVYPDVFEPTADGKARVKADANLEGKDLEELKNLCPSSAIIVE
jgi:ferredoxin